MRLLRRTATLISVSLLATACSASTDGGAGGSSSPTGSRASAPTSQGSDPAAASSSTSATVGSTTSSGGCTDEVISRLTLKQQLGQLVMVGLQAGTPTSAVTGLIRDQHVGNVIYLGGWEGAPDITRTSRTLQDQVSEESTGGLRLFIAADQEGGEIWQIRSTGAPRLPSALEQGKATPAQRVAYGKQLGTLLDKVGVNLNLAPVADTVPPELGKANEPIGKWGRQYANDPDTVSAAVPDIIRGLHDGGVAATVKHFPGIGRIRGNTDFTNKDVVDNEATRQDPYLEPFRAGIRAGTDMVMVSSARYPRIDADNPALFSSAIVEDLLRKDLSYDGVVITDDIAAAAVEEVPPGERATRYVAAGGDILLTGDAAEVKPMLKALAAKVSADPKFEAKVKASVRRVVELKAKRGLIDCG